jgi:Ala-tRNA(Pro) deacylase
MADVTSFLDEAGVEYEVLDLAPEEVAKTLVLTTPEGNARAVLPASERIDLRKVGDLVGASGKKVQLASEDELARDYPEFELGAVPPFGGRADRVIVDERLASRDSIALEAGSHERSVRMKAADLVRLTGAQVADISREER